MDFELTEDQIELARTVRAVLDRECPPSLVRGVVEQGGEERGVGERGEEEEALWSTLRGLDWPGLALPEALGGLGATWVEQAIVLEELGRAAAPGPFLATVTQFAPVVLEAGTTEHHKRWIGPVAAGELTGTIAVDEGRGSWASTDVTALARPDGGGYRLEGTKRFVLDGATAEEIVVAVRLDDDLALVVVPGADVAATEVTPIDTTTRHADVALDGVRVEGDRLLAAGPAAESALERALEEAVTAVAISTVGTCQRILDLVVDHVGEREQFGLPIGSFQAVKHKLVDMYRDVERARVLGYFSALCIAEADGRRPLAAAMAKASAGEAQRRVFEDGLQLFGGIGYTWEHDLHLYLRRAKVGELHLGSSARHRRRVAELFLADQRRGPGAHPAGHHPAGHRPPTSHESRSEERPQ